LTNDLNNARYLWKRIPTNAKSDDVKAVWAITQAMWKKNYQEIYASLNHQFKNPEKALVDDLLASFRQRTFSLLSDSYVSISVRDASVFLGLNENDAKTFVTQHGWQVQNDIFIPTPQKKVKDQNTGIAQLQQLGTYFSFLES